MLLVYVFLLSSLCISVTRASYPSSGANLFAKVALNTTSDKVWVHSYQEMYGQFLIPYIKEKHKQKENVRFFEIGLGCAGDKFYGGSANIWSRIFKKGDVLWMADEQV